jgi:hypothetical protein
MTEVLRMHAAITGIVTGFAAGLIVFVATNWLVIKGGPVVGPHLALLGQYFIGYRVTFAGSLVGFGYAFACGFILAYGVARLYNWIVDLRTPKPTEA